MTIIDSVPDVKLTPDAERLGLLLHALDNPNSNYGSLDSDQRDAIRSQVLDYARAHRIHPQNFGSEQEKEKRKRVRRHERTRKRDEPRKPAAAIAETRVPVRDALFTTEQLAIDLTLEPFKLYQPDKLRVPGRFALCSKLGTEKLQQQLYDVSQLDTVMREVASMPDRDQRHFWIGQSTLAPYAVNRRISSVMLLNAVWVDIDLAHPPKSFPADALPPWSDDKDAEVLARVLVAQLEDATGITASQVVATGGGLLLRLNFDEALPAIARPRWSSVQQHLVKLVSDLCPAAAFPKARQWRWPVDASASDAARILRLVGTVNPRWNTRCRVVYDSGTRYSFDELADKLLPYTREEVAAFRAKMAEGAHWTKNREKAAAVGIRTGKLAAQTQDPAAATQGLIEDEAARMLWAGRFEFGRELLTTRGGASEGHRNNWFWPLANALAWSCTGSEQLIQELAALHHQHFNHGNWTRGEAMQAAGSVLKRMGEGKDKLYKMRSVKFAELLEATPLELREFGHLLSGSGSAHNLKRSEWNQGAMGFEKMQGLSSEAFIAETRRRQAEAGRYAAAKRQTTHAPELREQARQMAAEGKKEREIAAALGVSNATAHRWCKA